MFGDEYISQHIFQTYCAEQKELAYKIYVTDVLGLICANTARIAGGQIVNTRYYDLINKQDNEPQRTSEDIISSITDTLNEMGKEEQDG